MLPLLDAFSFTRRVVTGLFLFVAATAALMSQPPAKPKTEAASKGPSGTRISARPADTSMEGLLIRYEDTRTAGAIFIRDSVAEAEAAQWLAQINQVQDAPGAGGGSTDESFPGPCGGSKAVQWRSVRGLVARN